MSLGREVIQERGRWPFVRCYIKYKYIRPDLYLTGNHCKASVPLEGRYGQSRDRPRLTLSVSLRTDESLDRLQTSRERWAACEYPKESGHHASGCDIEVETPPWPTTDYLGKEMTTGIRSHRETAFLETGDLCFGRQRHHHVNGRRRHDDRHGSYTYSYRYTWRQWLMALKLTTG